MPPTRSARFLSPFQEFFRTEAAGGALLVACACAALLIANSPWAEAFAGFWASPLSISAAGHSLTLSVHQWINDGLMAIFFLLVGLEIKREALVGELASPRQAALPIAGALGGMFVPALVYAMVNPGGAAAHGWAIPMATDIAFALGVLALAAPHAPAGLKIFLAALAIVDDMGAVLVIALFYTSAIAWGPLLVAGAIVAMLVALNVGGGPTSDAVSAARHRALVLRSRVGCTCDDRRRRTRLRDSHTDAHRCRPVFSAGARTADAVRSHRDR